ncbi:MAG: NAD-dependent epimerase/dehydratase family protein [Magnetococcales bacterium]|nr:NAD-dependent epimerase/dehydratase family protein [Magnetococcales bacterium]
MRTLITGAAGFVGYWLARSLVEDGRKVILVDNFKRGRHDQDFEGLLAHPAVTFHTVDLTTPNPLAMIDPDSIGEIYHLAAINGTENFYNIPDQVLKVNVLGTLNVLDYARDHGNIKVLYASSSEVYAGTVEMQGSKFIPSGEDIPLCIQDITNPRWSYGASKLLGESACVSYDKAYGLPFCIFRFHNIYGPRMGFEHVIPQFMQRIHRGEVPLNVYGVDQTRAFCHVSDAVAGIRLLMETSGTSGIYHVGNDLEEIRIDDLARLVLRTVGRKEEIIPHEAPSGSVSRRCPKLDKLRILGYTPKVPLAEGLKSTWAWYKSYFDQISGVC